MTLRLLPIAFAMMLAGAVMPMRAPAQSAATAADADIAPATPGFFRTRLGTFEVDAIADGAYHFVASAFLDGIPPSELKRELADAYLTDDYPQAINTFLVKTPSKLILVDTGLGEMPSKIPALLGILGKSGYGHLVENIHAAGYTPEQVDEILITHLHVDHIGGLVRDGRAVFPNATIRVDQRDVDFWLSDAQAASHPALAPLFAAAKMALAPYRASGHLKPFSGGVAIAPGVRAMPAAGHTPGHTAYQFESAGQRLIVWGDVLHVPAVQFAHPAVAMKFDLDQAAATKTREAVLAETGADGELVAGAHLFWPGIGRVRKEGAGYRWVPIAYPAQ